MKKNYKTLVCFGMLFLVLGNLSFHYLRPMPHFGDGLVGATSGVLIGMSIGFNLWAVKVKRRLACGS